MDWFMCLSMDHPFWTRVVDSVGDKGVIQLLTLMGRIRKDLPDQISARYISNICGIRLDRANKLLPWLKELIDISPRSGKDRMNKYPTSGQQVSDKGVDNDAVNQSYLESSENHRKKERIDKNITPQTPQGAGTVREKFEAFWSIYPKKVSKGHAEKSWNTHQLHRHFDEIIAALERHKRSAEWAKDNGAFIPNPGTWLNGKRWLDVMPSEAPEFKPRSKIDEALSRQTMTNRYTQEVYEMSRFTRHPTQPTALLDDTGQTVQLSDLDWG